MTILVDTNVWLDIIEKRQMHFETSYSAVRKAIEDDAVCLVSASSVTDIYYLLKKHFRSTAEAKRYVEWLAQVAYFADVLGEDIESALAMNLSDFEDAVVCAVASRYDTTFILTRNVKDFTGGAVPALTPQDYLTLY